MSITPADSGTVGNARIVNMGYDLKPGDVIKIKVGSDYYDGVVIERSDCASAWWVNANIKGIQETRIYYHDQIVSWNYAPQYCECGAVKLNHPGHSDWCPLFEP